MPRTATDLRDDDLTVQVVHAFNDNERGPIYVFSLNATPRVEPHEMGIPQNVGLLILREEHVIQIQEAIAEARGWKETNAEWMKGIGMSADVEPEAEQ